MQINQPTVITKLQCALLYGGRFDFDGQYRASTAGKISDMLGPSIPLPPKPLLESPGYRRVSSNKSSRHFFDDGGDDECVECSRADCGPIYRFGGRNWMETGFSQFEGARDPAISPRDLSRDPTHP